MGANLMTGVLIRRPREKTQTHTLGRRPHEDKGRDWSDAATSQGTSGATRGWKRLLPEPPEGVWPRQHLDFRLLASKM